MDNPSKTGLEPVPTNNNFETAIIREILIPGITRNYYFSLYKPKKLCYKCLSI